MNIKDYIRTIPDFPKKGIQFRDICSLIRDPVGLKMTVDLFAQKYRAIQFDYIVGIESRGFILGAPLAYALGKGFIPLRKKGKLPGETIAVDYELEYGRDTIEIQKGSLKAGDRVLLIDDLLATGGTMVGALTLIEKVGATVIDCAFVVDLPEIGGGKKLRERGFDYFYLCSFEGH